MAKIILACFLSSQDGIPVSLRIAPGQHIGKVCGCTQNVLQFNCCQKELQYEVKIRGLKQSLKWHTELVAVVNCLAWIR